jgi:hypothetical protein
MAAFHTPPLPQGINAPAESIVVGVATDAPPRTGHMHVQARTNLQKGEEKRVSSPPGSPDFWYFGDTALRPWSETPSQ